jgi:hypothetical protein
VQVFVAFTVVVTDASPAGRDNRTKGTTVVCVQPTPAPPPVAPAPGRPRNQRLRLWLALSLGVVLLLCLGGAGVFFSLYDKATKIQRSDPDAVVDSYLGAYFVDRDDQAARLYTCKTGGNLQPMADLRNQITNREKTNGTKVSVDWGSLQVTGSGSDRTVETDLTISGSSNGQAVSSHAETWDFHLVDQNGWRVCGATKVR